MRAGTRKVRVVAGGIVLSASATLAFLPACEPEGVVPTPDLAARLAVGLEQLPFRGVRVYTNRYAEAPFQSKEEVASDGKGGYSLKLLEKDGLDPKAFADKHGDRAWINAQAKLHLSAWYTVGFRDFQVRDPELFLRNYLLSPEAATGTVAGREALEIRLIRRSDGKSYSLSLDKEHDLPLRIVERDGTGRVLSELEYERVDFQPDLSRQRLGPLESNPLAVADPASVSGELGFAPFVPAFLPEGFRRLRATLLRYPDGSSILADHYTDGVESFSIRQWIQPFSADFSGESKNPEPAPEGETVARRFVLGPLVLIETHVDKVYIVGGGKLDPGAMTAVMESLSEAK